MRTGKGIALRRSRRRFGLITNRSMVRSHFIWRTGKAYQGSDSVSQVRFQADWNLNHIIVQAAQCREPTLDFQTAHAASLLGVNDYDFDATDAHIAAG